MNYIVKICIKFISKNMEKIYLPPVSVEVESTDEVSDGYHTFGDLYRHRIELWIALCKINRISPTMLCEDGSNISDNSSPWRSKYHSDGELAFSGKWFLLGMFKQGGNQMTYHLPIERWDECNFAITLDKAPEFDGHTSDDVLLRLKKL